MAISIVPVGRARNSSSELVLKRLAIILQWELAVTCQQEMLCQHRCQGTREVSEGSNWQISYGQGKRIALGRTSGRGQGATQQIALQVIFNQHYLRALEKEPPFPEAPANWQGIRKRGNDFRKGFKKGLLEAVKKTYNHVPRKPL